MWLGSRIAVLIRALAWEIPYAMGVALKSKNINIQIKKKEKLKDTEFMETAQAVQECPGEPAP